MDDVRVRIYRPISSANIETKDPIMIYIHGGGKNISNYFFLTVLKNLIFFLFNLSLFYGSKINLLLF